jgi:hypothetical protein
MNIVDHLSDSPLYVVKAVDMYFDYAKLYFDINTQISTEVWALHNEIFRRIEEKVGSDDLKSAGLIVKAGRRYLNNDKDIQNQIRVLIDYIRTAVQITNKQLNRNQSDDWLDDDEEDEVNEKIQDAVTAAKKLYNRIKNKVKVEVEDDEADNPLRIRQHNLNLQPHRMFQSNRKKVQVYQHTHVHHLHLHHLHNKTTINLNSMEEMMEVMIMLMIKIMPKKTNRTNNTPPPLIQHNIQSRKDAYWVLRKYISSYSQTASGLLWYLIGTVYPKPPRGAPEENEYDESKNRKLDNKQKGQIAVVSFIAEILPTLDEFAKYEDRRHYDFFHTA